MSYLNYSEHPELRRSMLVMALAGWPDAGEAATRAVREFAQLIKATRFATIEPEEFYDFSSYRPIVATTQNGNRRITWPKNEFSYWRAADHGIASDRDIIVFLGVEPNLRWKAYRDAVMQVAGEGKVDLLLVVGSLLAPVPHTRPPRIAGSSSTLELGPGLEHIRYTPPAYEGPASMTSVIMEAMGRQKVPQVSLWGQCPHYLQVAHNPSVSAALLAKVQQFVPVKLDIARIEKEAAAFTVTVAKALQTQNELAQHVRKLEQAYDSESATPRPDEPAESGDVLKDLEAYLRSQRGHPDENNGDPKS